MLKSLEHQLHRFSQILAAGVDLQFRCFRGFVGAGDSGELLDLASAGLGVETLGIAGFAHVQVCGAVDLKEVTVVNQLPGFVPVGTEGRDEGCEHNYARIEKELRHLSDAADVFLPVRIGEAQVLAEAVADVVAIQHIGGQAPREQGCVHGIGQGAFARAGKTGEPEDGAAMAALLSPGCPVDGGLVPGDVGGRPLVGELSIGGACGHDQGMEVAAFSLNHPHVSVGSPPRSTAQASVPPGPPAVQSHRLWRCRHCRCGSSAFSTGP